MHIGAEYLSKARPLEWPTKEAEAPIPSTQVQSIQHNQILAQKVNDSRRREWSRQKPPVDRLNRCGNYPKSLDLMQNQILTVNQEGPLQQQEEAPRYRAKSKNSTNCRIGMKPNSRKTVTKKPIFSISTPKHRKRLEKFLSMQIT
jgi:hypothetical protein